MNDRRREPQTHRPRSRALHIGRLWPAQGEGGAVAWEVRPARRSLNGLFDALRALAGETLAGDGFVYLAAPVPLSAREIGHVADHAAAARLLPRLCLGVPYVPGFIEGPDRCADIEAAGLRAALDDVDDARTFRDFAHYPVCAVRFSTALAGACVADPRAAAVLEAMAGLAHNLGRVTLASGVAPELRDPLAALGVGWLGLAPATGSRSAAAPATHSRSRYPDALYEP